MAPPHGAIALHTVPPCPWAVRARPALRGSSRLGISERCSPSRFGLGVCRHIQLRGLGRRSDGGIVRGIEPHTDGPAPLAEAALNRHPREFQLGHHAGRELDAGRTQLGIGHRGAGRATQSTEHQRLLMIKALQPDLRRPDVTASAPGSTGRAVREGLGAQDPTSWPDQHRAIRIIRLRRRALA